jgi:hypothetical protein
VSAAIIWNTAGPPLETRSPATANHRAKRQAGKRAQLRLDDTLKQSFAASLERRDF